MPALRIKSIRELNLRAKSVFMRLDFNVPLSEPNASGVRTITDDTRIREAIPTIKYALEQGAKVILASHLGRPDGKPNPDFSLEPVATHLAELLVRDVTLADDCIGDGIELLAKNQKAGDILLLENLRFHAEEERNDPKFCARLARLAQVFVTDAFGTAHRKHASTYGVPALFNDKGMGMLIEKEIKFLDMLLNRAQKPFYLILGGAKISDKIRAIESLIPRIDGIVIGGAMAYAFMKAKDQALPEGARIPAEEDVEVARNLIATAERKSLPILLPVDFVESFDLGPNSINQFCNFLVKARTVFWNGPLGYFEKPEFAKGTSEIARFVGSLQALKVVGGGDTVSAIQMSGVAAQYDHLSTGGGAALEYLEGKSLPGIEILTLPAIETPNLEI